MRPLAEEVRRQSRAQESPRVEHEPRDGRLLAGVAELRDRQCLGGVDWPQQVMVLVHLLQRHAEVVVIPVVREHKVLVEPGCVRVGGGRLTTTPSDSPLEAMSAASDIKSVQ